MARVQPPVKLNGRQSSVFTRVPRILAHELGVPLELEPIYDMTALDPAVYADNPAMKLPSLRVDGTVLFGAVNICRSIAEHAGAAHRVVWPEDARDTRGRNAHELVFHGMAAQVQLAFGTQVCKLPRDNVYFVKAAEGLVRSLRWLDANLDHVLAAFPPQRITSVLEIGLFCLLEHLEFRRTVEVPHLPALRGFTAGFAQRPSAIATVYAFDVPPATG